MELPIPESHPEQLEWPPNVNLVLGDTRRRSDSTDKRAFGLEEAVNAFGDAFVKKLQHHNKEFLGDWWAYACLLRVVDAVNAADTKARQPNRYEWWNKNVSGRMVLHLIRARLAGLNLAKICIENAHFNTAILTSAVLQDSRIRHSSLYNANMEGVKGHNAVLHDVDMRGASIKNAVFDGVVFENVKSSRINAEYAHFVGATLSHIDFYGGTLARAKLTSACLEQSDLREADLRHAILNGANLSRARLQKAKLDGVHLERTNFVRAQGLYGKDRALADVDSIAIHHIQDAVFRHNSDKVGWDTLRSIGSLKIFGISYLTVVIIVSYVAVAAQFNAAAAHARDVASGFIQAETSHTEMWSRVLSRLPDLPVPGHLGRQLVATLCLAIAATIYALFCPAEIKEANEVKWTRELDQPLWEYRAANWSRMKMRYACAVLFALGGAHSLFYLAKRAYHAGLYLLF